MGIGIRGKVSIGAVYQPAVTFIQRAGAGFIFKIFLIGAVMGLTGRCWPRPGFQLP